MVRDLMWRHAGLLRSRDTLSDLVTQLSSWWGYLAGIRGLGAPLIATSVVYRAWSPLAC
jgi:hypothetical protein